MALHNEWHCTTVIFLQQQPAGIEVENIENIHEYSSIQVQDYSTESKKLFNVVAIGKTTNSSLHSNSSSHVETTPHINSTSTNQPRNDNPTTISISEELYRCSRALGMSEQSLLINKDAITEVSSRCTTFLGKVKSLLPPAFSKRYRNPCWTAKKLKFTSARIKKVMSYFQPFDGRRVRPKVGRKYSKYLSRPVRENSKESKILLCLPYFFLAGFPKSATTTVHEVLSNLPGIVAPKLGKEPHWWTRALYLSGSETFNSEYIPIAFTSYAHFFETISSRLTAELNIAKSNTRLITYDGSQSTLWDSNFFYGSQDFCGMPAVVSRVLPNVKFIVVMRNPVTRLYSHFAYSYKLRYGNVRNWPPQLKLQVPNLFHKQITKDIAAFKKCLEQMSAFECASSSISPSTGNDQTATLNHRVAIGLYAIHIKKWLQFYPRENFLFLKMEELTKNASKSISQITTFLDLSPFSRVESLFGRENVLNDNFQAMEERTKSLLDDFYRPFNEALAALLNDDRYLWNDQ